MSVAVEWCGICGTDVEEYTDGPIIIPTAPHPLTSAMPPITLGHEVAGRVTDRGPDVELKPGTLVALDGYLTCTTCHACRRGELNRCERWAHIGLSADGGLAERLVVPAEMAIPAPDAVAADHLALAEPCAVAVRAVRRAAITAGDRALVLGGGAIGLLTLQVLLSRGCGGVTMVDSLTERRRLATRLGAEATVAGIDELLAGGLAGRFDLIVDCSGSAEVPVDALPLARAGGRVVLVGLPAQASTLRLTSVVLRELSLIGSIGHVRDEDTRTAVSLIATGDVEAASLITHRLPLEYAVSDGIAFLAGPDRWTALKIIVSPLLGPGDRAHRAEPAVNTSGRAARGSVPS